LARFRGRISGGRCYRETAWNGGEQWITSAQLTQQKPPLDFTRAARGNHPVHLLFITIIHPPARSPVPRARARRPADGKRAARI